MADHKLQHFVPRCHLKPFSLNTEGKSINLLHIDNLKLFKNVSVRNQCAKPYFYGADLILETSFQRPEGHYASLIKRLENKDSLDHRAMTFLRDFSHLQSLRTETAAKRQLAATVAMRDTIFEGQEGDREFFIPSFKQIVQESVAMFVKTYDYITDLKILILQNETDIDFITSDNPAASYNRLYTQRLGPTAGQAGLANAGLIISMPLTPRYCLICYDPDTYTCSNKSSGITQTRRIEDIEAINQLQYICSKNAIYFSNWNQREMVSSSASFCQSLRREDWHRVHYAVPDEGKSTDATRVYRTVHTLEEKLAFREGLIHLESFMPAPTKWFSGLKFRSNPRYIDTKTGSGIVRRATVRFSR